MNRLILAAMLVVLCAPFADAQKSFHDGFFQATRFDETLGEIVSNLDGTNGLVVSGPSPLDSLGFSLASAGDFNGDGIDDLILGDPFANASGLANVGAAYVLFGSADGFAPTFDVTKLDGANGFLIHGTAGQRLSGLVGAAGDLNDDGLADIAVNLAGSMKIVYGSAAPMPAALDASAVDQRQGFTLSVDRPVSSVGPAGDVNNDGVSDLVFATFGGDPLSIPARTYVVFGAASNLGDRLDVATLDGVRGFAIGNSGVNFGTSQTANGAGDVNGDGIADLIVGQPRAGDGATGEAYVLFGTGDGFPALVDVQSLNGSSGFSLHATGDQIQSVGFSVDSAGDVNGDGLSDIVVGAPNYDYSGMGFSEPFLNAGQALVVLGSKAGFPPTLDLAALDGHDGFLLRGDCGAPDDGLCESLDGAGYRVSKLGDFNGDGLDDLLVGAPGLPLSSAEAYILFGSADGFPARIDVGTTDSFSGYQGLLNGRNGFAFDLGESSPFINMRLASAGDFNGDGLADFLVGLPDSNKVFAIFGQVAPEPGFLPFFLATVIAAALQRRRLLRLAPCALPPVHVGG